MPRYMACGNGKVGRRFYNQGLKVDVYDKCLLATKNHYEALNSLPEEEFAKQSLTTCGGWTQTTYVPPPRTFTVTGLSQTFQQFDPGKTSTSSRKKAKLSQEPTVRDKEEDDIKVSTWATRSSTALGVTFKSIDSWLEPATTSLLPTAWQLAEAGMV